MKTLYFSLCTMLLFVVFACSSSKSASSDTKSSSSGNGEPQQEMNTSIDLADHLKKVPGVTVTGSGSSAKVSIRGMSSSTGESEPLFVINGTPINGGLAAANALVIVNDIQSIKVLKTPSETSFYGLRGSSGVIVIQLKS